MSSERRRRRRADQMMNAGYEQAAFVEIEPLARPRVPYAAAECRACKMVFPVYSIFDGCLFCRSLDWQITP